MKRRLVILAAISAATFGSIAPALPGQASLVDIMQGLRNDTVEVADGLLTGDLDKVADGAERIANHPRIPSEQVKLVAAALGGEMAAFKGFDTAVHDLAVSIADAARSGDEVRATADFQQMLSGCFGCHAAFKERVSATLRKVSQ